MYDNSSRSTSRLLQFLTSSSCAKVKNTSNPYSNNFTSWAHNLLRKRTIHTVKPDLLMRKQQHREAERTYSKDGDAMRTTELRHVRKYLSNRNNVSGVENHKFFKAIIALKFPTFYRQITNTVTAYYLITDSGPTDGLQMAYKQLSFQQT